MRKNNKITVLGAGLWGTVLAQHISRNKRAGDVWLWEFFENFSHKLDIEKRHPGLPGFAINREIRITSDLKAALNDCAILLFVLPSEFIAKAAVDVKKSLGKNRPWIVNASKGFEFGNLKTMGDIISLKIPQARGVYTFSGPSFAKEVALGVPTEMILAGSNAIGRKQIKKILEGPKLKVTESSDRKGVELGGSLKNAYAIGCGVLDGLEGVGANTKAALISGSVFEMAALIVRCGGKKETVYGPAGLGDLIATGTSTHSRNRSFGEKLGHGKSAKAALQEIPTVVEGKSALQSVLKLARRLKIRTPILNAIGEIVNGGKSPQLILKALGFATNG